MSPRILRPALAFVIAGLAGSVPAAADLRPASCPPKLSVVIHVVAKGVWLGNSTGARCFVPHKAGALDTAALDNEIAAVAGGCTSAVELASTGGSSGSYQEIITIMDLAVKRGLSDVGLSSPDVLSIKFHDTPATQRAASRRCPSLVNAAPASPRAARPPAPASAGSGAHPAGGHAPVAGVPIIAVTPAALELRAGTGAPVPLGTLAGLAGGKGSVAPLVRALAALPAPSNPRNKGLVILEANGELDTSSLMRILEACRAAGFDRVLFSVKDAP